MTASVSPFSQNAVRGDGVLLQFLPRPSVRPESPRVGARLEERWAAPSASPPRAKRYSVLGRDVLDDALPDFHRADDLYVAMISDRGVTTVTRQLWHDPFTSVSGKASFGLRILYSQAEGMPASARLAVLEVGRLT